MNRDLEIIGDGSGFAILGAPHEVEHFVAAHDLESRAIDLSRLSSRLGSSAALAQSSSTLASTSGRWVKLTEKSAEAMKHSPLMKGSASGTSRAIVTDGANKTKHILEIVSTPGSLLTNPAVLTGAAGIMAQLAMQQAMDEITDYLQTIDRKVDEILRAQKDAVRADMIGVGILLDEAMVVRAETGKVSATTWSKIQGSSATLASTMAYALLQLDAVAEKLETQSSLDEVAAISSGVASQVQEWLSLIARCCQLHDALSLLELDRVLDHDPDELELHRSGLQIARQKRLEQVADRTAELLDRIEAVTARANAKVLFHPFDARKVHSAMSETGVGIDRFREALDIGPDFQAVEARTWLGAVNDTRERALVSSVEGVETVARFGSRTFDQARAATEKVTEGITTRMRRTFDKTEDDKSSEM